MFSKNKYKYGHWFWNQTNNKLECISALLNESAITPGGNIQQTSAEKIDGNNEKSSACGHENLNIRFRETVDALDQVRFKRIYRRKTIMNEPDVVTIQDIRDVVLFTISPKQLTLDYITYFHLPSMDFLLRTLIVYFQYYFQIWEKLMIKREESKRKMRHPGVAIAEKKLANELSDLRSMVSRAYLSFLIGASDTEKFHHIKSNKNKCSQGEKDIRFIEFLYQICTRVVWIALLKRNHNLIEMEMHRMFRSDTYNVMAHRQRGQELKWLDYEYYVLNGDCAVEESKLLQRSLIGKEMYLDHHDYRLLSLGIVNFPDTDERIEYLKIAYTAPEEELLKLGVPVGILGYERTEFDAVLTLRFARNDDGTVRQFPKMILPPKRIINKMKLVKFPEVTEKTILEKQPKSTKAQCSLWKSYFWPDKEQRPVSEWT